MTRPPLCRAAGPNHSPSSDGAITRAAPAVMGVLACAALFGLCSCRSGRAEARRAVATQLTTRERDRARSMRLFDEAMLARRASDYKLARQRLLEAVAADRDNVYAWMVLGSVDFDGENYYDAAQAFYQAARLAPTRYEPRYNLGAVFEDAGRYDDAIREYEAALKIEPGQLEVTENLARAYVRADKSPERAKELIDKALETEFRLEWRQWLQRMSVRLKPPEPSTKPADTGATPDPATGGIRLRFDGAGEREAGTSTNFPTAKPE